MASYRVVVIALLAAITYYFTGNAGQSTIISVVFNVAGSFVYYAYERLWGAIRWGRSRAPQPDGARLPPTQVGVNLVAAVTEEENVLQED